MKISHPRKDWVAIIEDIDCGNLDKFQQREVYDLLATRKVIIFRDQKLNNEQLKKFAQIFGWVWDRAKEKYSGLMQTDIHGHEDSFVEVVSESGLLGQGIIPWHVDLTHYPGQTLPNRLLYAVELEGAPACTEFIDTIQGAKLLDPQQYDFLKSTQILCRAPYKTPWDAYMRRPALSWHPAHKDYALWADGLFTVWVEGIKVPIEEYMQPIIKEMRNNETYYAHEWKLGDLMVYDNWSTMHYRGSFEGQRKLKRVTWDQDWYRYGEPKYV